MSFSANYKSSFVRILVTLSALVCVLVANLPTCQASVGFSKLLPISRARVIDESADSYNSPAQLAQLATLVCKHNHDSKLIGRISTVVKLADYFEEQQVTMNDCNEKYGASIRNLKNVVSVGNDNICGDEKISLIEEFHKRFISTLGEDLELREAKESVQVPRMLLNFFAHYATQVSRMCKEIVVPLLEMDVNKRFTQESDYSIGAGGDFTGKVTQTMGNFFQSVHHYDDVLLVWDLVDKTTSKQKVNEKSLIVDTVDEATGEPVKLLMVANNIRALLMAQQKCRNRFRPIYSKIILPVVRLADIGYSFAENELEVDEGLPLRGNKLVERWYRLTQFCETLLPVQFLQDEKLEDKGTLVITLAEREKYLEETAKVLKELSGAQEADSTEYEYEPPKGINDLSEDKLTTLRSADGGSLVVRKVKTSASARSRNVRRFIARFVRGLKKISTGKVSFSRLAAESFGGSGDGQINGELAVSDFTSILRRPSVEQGLQKLERDENNQGKSLTKRSLLLVIMEVVAALAVIGLIVGFVMIIVVAASSAG